MANTCPQMNDTVGDNDDMNCLLMLMKNYHGNSERKQKQNLKEEDKRPMAKAGFIFNHNQNFIGELINLFIKFYYLTAMNLPQNNAN